MASNFRENLRREIDKLSKATGKEHFLATERVKGILLGKVELSEKEWGRVGQEGGRVALVPWRGDVVKSLGKEISFNPENDPVLNEKIAKLKELKLSDDGEIIEGE
mgnify:CR=1 FL=1